MKPAIFSDFAKKWGINNKGVVTVKNKDGEKETITLDSKANFNRFFTLKYNAMEAEGKPFGPPQMEDGEVFYNYETDADIAVEKIVMAHFEQMIGVGKDKRDNVLDFSDFAALDSAKGYHSQVIEREGLLGSNHEEAVAKLSDWKNHSIMEGTRVEDLILSHLNGSQNAFDGYDVDGDGHITETDLAFHDADDFLELEAGKTQGRPASGIQIIVNDKDQYTPPHLENK